MARVPRSRLVHPRVRKSRRSSSEFAAYTGVAECVAVGNGTDALELALRALTIGPGDAVATVANAGMYATTAIRAAGAMPAYVEIDASTLQMDPAALAAGPHRSRAR